MIFMPDLGTVIAVALATAYLVVINEALASVESVSELVSNMRILEGCQSFIKAHPN
jgi:hypothetical protein